jgi:hypothetical protein
MAQLARLSSVQARPAPRHLLGKISEIPVRGVRRTPLSIEPVSMLTSVGDRYCANGTSQNDLTSNKLVHALCAACNSTADLSRC